MAHIAARPRTGDHTGWDEAVQELLRAADDRGGDRITVGQELLQAVLNALKERSADDKGVLPGDSLIKDTLNRLKDIDDNLLKDIDAHTLDTSQDPTRPKDIDVNP